jgi:hypothetical protein
MLVLGLSALACDAMDDIEEGPGQDVAGKADDGGRESGTIFFVYDNHRVCIAAPCPSYTLITPGAVRFDVARVDIDPQAAEAAPLVADGGALVHGALENGSWSPGDKGPGIVIDELLEPARPYLVARHSGGAAAPYAVVNAEGMDHHVDRIDLDGFVPTDPEGEATLATLVAGAWAATGFLARSDTGEVTLFVTGEAGESIPCMVAASGIECVSGPCPIWKLTSMEGEPLGNAERVELGYLHLSDSDAAAEKDLLYQKGGAVFGWMSEDVLLVVRLLDP